LAYTHDGVIFKNVTLDCAASDFASIVLPVPAGPKSMIPEMAFLREFV
jgi:hypothetical protein